MKRSLKIIIFAGFLGSLQATPTRVFIGTGGDGIYSAILNEESGGLSEPKCAVEVKGSGFLTLAKDGGRLFATANGGVAAYEVDGIALKLYEVVGGVLRTNAQSYPGKGFCHVSLDATERVLFAADYSGGAVASFPVGKDGRIGPVASHVKHEGASVHPQRQKRPHAHSFYPGPDNKYAYAPDLGTDRVEIYSFDVSSGVLESVGAAKVPPGSGPRHMKFGRDGRYAYVLNELTLTVSMFKRNSSDGMLKLLETTPVLPADADGVKMTCSEILVSKDGRFIYTANRDLTEQKRDSLSMLKVGKDGRLTHGQTIPAEVWIPRNINLTPSGKCLLVAGQKSNEVTVFHVDGKTGLLSFTGNRQPVPLAMCIVFP